MIALRGRGRLRAAIQKHQITTRPRRRYYVHNQVSDGSIMLVRAYCMKSTVSLSLSIYIYIYIYIITCFVNTLSSSESVPHPLTLPFRSLRRITRAQKHCRSVCPVGILLQPTIMKQQAMYTVCFKQTSCQRGVQLEKWMLLFRVHVVVYHSLYTYDICWVLYSSLA